MKCIYFFIRVFLLLLPLSAFSQHIYQQIDNSNGLSNSCINDIYLDSDNLVWFATWDGLNYFDGNNIHVFNYEKGDLNHNSIASNVIYQVTEDKQRNIWIGTVEGVSRYNKNTGEFRNYFYSRKKAVSNGYTVAVNNNGEVYAARRNSAQLLKYNATTDVFTPVKLSSSGSFMLNKMLFDGQGRLWLLNSEKILEAYRPGAGGFVKENNFPVMSDIDNLFFCNNSIYYTKSNNELYGINNDHVRKIAILPHEVREMRLYKDHYLFAWSSKGIGEYNEEFIPVDGLTNEIPFLGNMRATSMMSDGKNLLWIGTDGNGVIKITNKENYFGIIQQQARGEAFHIPVRAFCQVDNELWIGTKGNGIITLKNWDKKDVSFSTIKNFHTNVDLLDNCVYAIVKGSDGLVYIGSDAQGITLYNLKTQKFINWGDIRGIRSYPSFGSVHCIIYDRDSSVWLGLNEGGLVHCKLAVNSNGQISIKNLKQYKYNDVTQQGPGNNVIYSLAQSTDDKLWIGCRYGGLTMFNKTTQKFTTIKAYSYNGSISNNDVLSLYIDNRNRLWIGTSFGLNWVDERVAATSTDPVFKKLYVDDGLPNNTIHAIDEDNSGNIWISTNKGLAKINPASLKIVQYKQSDGLQSDEFSDNAVWKNSAGMLFFGGIYGFNYFIPEHIHLNNEQPRLLLTDLRFAGRNSTESGLIVLTKNGQQPVKHFDLRPNEDYFELNVTPIAYTDAQKCQYAYNLEGDDKTWHYMENNDRIIYNKLPAGNYTLRIKWSNGEGAWTQPVAAFSITVKQYFWLMPEAFVLYALLLAGAGYGYLRYKKNRFVMRQELKMEHMLREKDEALHQEQLSFFTNIAHELQTPLTLILGSLERYIFKYNTGEGKQAGNFLSIIKQEASRLHYLVQQLLEFRKAEAGRLANHFSYINISTLSGNIGGLFTALIEEKQLVFTCQVEQNIELWTDKDKIEKITFNLLSNAFKYTPDNENIIFSVNALRQEARLEIIVANSGCQLTEAETSRLFDRFFAVDSKQNKVGTGIGLAFTQQIVNLLGGEIAVSCENNWIKFRVLLPLDFVPDKSQVVDTTEKSGNASYFVSSMNTGKARINVTPIADNNKKSLIKSFEQENKRSILIVEDDELIRYLLKDILQENYILYEAGSGFEALEVVKRSCPDLIISDIMMPDMDGLELCNIIKNTTETCHVPFVMLSARTTMEQKTEGYNCGADAYIPKPFQTEHLLVRVHKLLEYQKKLHQLFSAGQNIISTVSTHDLDENDRAFIKKATRVIEENMNEELDGEFLEKALNMSRIQLYRKIKTMSDMTPTELIRHIRLQKAAALLKTTDLTVSEIFYRTGFNNKTYFFREFKKMFNTSPNDFRQLHRLPDFNHN
jgi:signal transduction histidine kinase/DNA-binding response OmpR family regulator/ligand-binding sensor domain-containing protein